MNNNPLDEFGLDTLALSWESLRRSIGGVTVAAGLLGAPHTSAGSASSGFNRPELVKSEKAQIPVQVSKKTRQSTTRPVKEHKKENRLYEEAKKRPVLTDEEAKEQEEAGKEIERMFKERFPNADPNDPWGDNKPAAPGPAFSNDLTTPSSKRVSKKRSSRV